MTTPYEQATAAIHAGFHGDPNTGSCAVPIHQSTAYIFNDAEHAASLFALKQFGWIYTRLNNPTTDVFEQRMATLEGGVGAVATASGQHAIFIALLNLVHVGGHIISSQSLYGGTVSLFKNTFKRFGIEASLVDFTDPNNIKKAVKPNTRAVFYESVANPKNEVFDYEQVAKAAHDCGLPVVCDNTVLTSVLFKPFDYGADISAYSATKMIGGHANSMGGIVVDSGNFDWGREPEKWPQFTKPDEHYHGLNFYETFGKLCYIVTCRTHWLRDLGGCISPTNSFYFLQGLETLALRAPKHSENALAVAQFLEKHPLVASVNYPGLASHPGHALAKRFMPKGTGAVLGFRIQGGRKAGQKFTESVKLAYHVTNICDARTIVTHPASTTHSQLNDAELISAGVSDDYIRVSVGLEDVRDIIADLDQALRASQ